MEPTGTAEAGQKEMTLALHYFHEANHCNARHTAAGRDIEMYGLML